MKDRVSIYETKKMRVEIGQHEVKKVFKIAPRYKTRFAREKGALVRLKGIQGFPQLIRSEGTTVVMSRLAGKNENNFSDEVLSNLRVLVENMLSAGVARHTLPERDLLIDNGTVNMVDFERVTLRNHSWSPVWLIAQKTTRFNLLRVISNHNPSLLSDDESQQLEKLTRVRERLQTLKKIRDIRYLWTPKKQAQTQDYTVKFESDKSHKNHS